MFITACYLYLFEAKFYRKVCVRMIVSRSGMFEYSRYALALNKQNYFPSIIRWEADMSIKSNSASQFHVKGCGSDVR